ncbi:MBL fold metallo-hydrolase RNA specificity domain-containing protein [Hydrogenimonas cancrithermarum]|uniref:MBL fold metallo-hydrolase n=1 Tax=Hydrogenimonas cancrithermarum TaxID=2993563 RepID=A0ABN6WRY2_9BACT|nr:MBL fold metallo-hydrolase [Hydrogenimonas cancrithermarum]BDY11758.1 MBL fold metallo-hydrolase [Hydrogenimonas cancrithermarum]
MAILQSFGAAEVVTGSCHLLRMEKGPTILVDCGMFQGTVEERNFEPFGFDPKKVDILLVTHAHLDHVGRIPKLVKEGFQGRIVTLKSTMELAEVVMLDSAHLMLEEYETRYRKAQRRGAEASVRQPLYTPDDVQLVYDLPMVFVEYDKPMEIAKGIVATFRNAGHILDSATIELDIYENGMEKKVVFSGDLGNHNDMVMRNPEYVEKADTLFIESTYGDRNHKGIAESVEEFKKIVVDTLLNQGNVLIPSFAIERTQEILCLLKRMYDEKKLPQCRIFLDSPMAIRATRLYDEYHEELSRECNDYLKRDGTIFEFPWVEYTSKPEESKKINEIESGCIIIAGSGMCTGGRILHHFKHRLWNEKNALLFVGYQAEGTLGRRIVNGERHLRIYHEEVVVRASIHTINGFSAHADQSELIDWMRRFERLDKIFLIHGEYDKQKIFKSAIAEKLAKKAHIVEPEEKIYV